MYRDDENEALKLSVRIFSGFHKGSRPLAFHAPRQEEGARVKSRDWGMVEQFAGGFSETAGDR
ncbi:hypothetical protein Csa_020842 [Cucumis sativus]|uniref:Uncharacterized protein n=1 Tax=Cucumis sativus TaxID=3659 RepID=A0A0A0KEP6_CUCSA|nr:hypothetical protein Csa_020842 [Cucumis sativus]